jgi:hypothetical protein
MALNLDGNINEDFRKLWELILIKGALHFVSYPFPRLQKINIEDNLNLGNPGKRVEIDQVIHLVLMEEKH